jgi:4-diphosphocytidyl-2-C-methyl-D-erythritol kinase
MADFPATEGWSRWPAPAKLNLFLRITGRRPDGYHALQTAFRLLDWGDVIHLRRRTDGVIVRVGAGADGVAEADDLMVRAAKLLRKETNCRQGADIGIEKNIPDGWRLRRRFVGCGQPYWSPSTGLWRLALGRRPAGGAGPGQLGADVPVFVRGRNAWAEGVGEVLTAIALPPAWYVLVASPGVHAATAALFQAPDLTRDAAPAKIAGFLSGTSPSGAVLDNAFEPVLRRREPAVEAVFAQLASIGTPRLTGSGSGCFVEFAQRESAEAALASLAARHPCLAGAGRGFAGRRCWMQWSGIQSTGASPRG